MLEPARSGDECKISANSSIQLQIFQTIVCRHVHHTTVKLLPRIRSKQTPIPPIFSFMRRTVEAAGLGLLSFCVRTRGQTLERKIRQARRKRRGLQKCKGFPPWSRKAISWNVWDKGHATVPSVVAESNPHFTPREPARRRGELPRVPTGDMRGLRV